MKPWKAIVLMLVITFRYSYFSCLSLVFNPLVYIHLIWNFSILLIYLLRICFTTLKGMLKLYLLISAELLRLRVILFYINTSHEKTKKLQHTGSEEKQSIDDIKRCEGEYITLYSIHLIFYICFSGHFDFIFDITMQVVCLKCEANTRICMNSVKTNVSLKNFCISIWFFKIYFKWYYTHSVYTAASSSKQKGYLMVFNSNLIFIWQGERNAS